MFAVFHASGIQRTTHDVVTHGWHLVFDGGAVLFPFTYILGDVLSEVYGFANARRVILTGFVVQIIASLTFWLIQIAPGDHTYRNQAAYDNAAGGHNRYTRGSSAPVLSY